MTALRREAIQLVEQMPEEQMASIIQYIYMLRSKAQDVTVFSDDKTKATSKMHAFIESEEMLTAVPQDIDYAKEFPD